LKPVELVDLHHKSVFDRLIAHVGVVVHMLVKLVKLAGYLRLVQQEMPEFSLELPYFLLKLGVVRYDLL